MGGYGSGRKPNTNCTEDYLFIDARQWQRDGCFKSGYSFNSTWSRSGLEIGSMGVTTTSNSVNLSYTAQVNGGLVEQQHYSVSLHTTPCHYGGLRYWFYCPAIGCNKRVAMLYLVGTKFACRHCSRLVYRCQRETKGYRGYRGAYKIRNKLGWSLGLTSPTQGKPKGMHWKTYIHLLQTYNHYADHAIQSMAANLESMNRLLAKMKVTA